MYSYTKKSAEYTRSKCLAKDLHSTRLHLTTRHERLPTAATQLGTTKGGGAQPPINQPVTQPQKPCGPMTCWWFAKPALARFCLWNLTLSGSRLRPSQLLCLALSCFRASSPSITFPSLYTARVDPLLPTFPLGVAILRKPSLDSACRKSSFACGRRGVSSSW